MRKLATIQVITNIKPIVGADNIVMCNVLGWELVIKKDEFKEGDPCIYCEIDSILPERPEFKFLESRKYRIKTIKLRGQISQGLCLPLSLIENKKYNIGDDVTDILGIKKYDPEAEVENKVIENTVSKPFWYKYLMQYKWFRNFIKKTTKGKNWPSFIKKTDEDRIQLFSNAYQYWKDLNFDITEKLDGQSGTFFIKKYKLFNIIPYYDYGVCSRNYRLGKPDNSSYWDIFNKYNLQNKLKKLFKELSCKDNLIIQGEIIGPKIQKNKYKVNKNEFYVFNIIRDTNIKYNTTTIKKLCDLVYLNHVPIIIIEGKIPDTIQEFVEYSIGNSLYNNKVSREGIVVRNYGKGISFKVINPKFLLEHDL